MSRSIGAVLILVGLAIGLTGLLALPGGHGRFAYLVEVTDPRPADESTMPEALRDLGATSAFVLQNPVPSAEVSQVLLLPELSTRLKNADCALGHLPSGRAWEALAGQDTGLGRGTMTVAGHDLTITGKLQSLAPVFDESLVMSASDEVQQVLVEAGWQSQVRYLLFSDTWQQRAELLDKLRAMPDALPTPDARVIASAKKPLLSHAVRIWISCALVLGGLVVAGRQFRGVSKDDLTRRFSQDTAKKS